MRDATKLDSYFNGDRTLFIIPLYQRKYAWEKKHCERLCQDLIKIHRNGIRSHFFGSIVTVRSSFVDDDLLIIDGQQRITTISLLVLAAINAVEAGEMENDEGTKYVERKRERYLYAIEKRIDRKIKLRPIESDMKAYDALINGDIDNIVPEDKSGITKNYNLFYNWIKTCGLSFGQLIEAIEKLIVIDIRLDVEDNPQLIFESLNSCGKDLEEADKVRNYLLMSLTADVQEDFYKRYWSRIERNTDDKPSMFIRDYLTMKLRVISSLDDLYFDFKKFDEEHNFNREELLADMLKYAEYYRQISKADTKRNKVDQKIWQLNNIGSNIGMPFYMAFLDYANTANLSEAEIYQVFDAIENYWARRIVCGYPSNVLAKVFAFLHSDVLKIFKQHEKRNMQIETSYAEVLKYILLKKQGNAIYPDDKDVRYEFPKRKIYHLVGDQRCFLFERMENVDSKEADKTIVQKMKEGKITIEHVMPQTLTAQWKAALGDNYQEIYDNYLHTFGNLTLTGYNSSYGNHSYSEKKVGYVDHKGVKVYGFNDSSFRLSNYMKTHDKWTLDEILERQNELLETFLYLWPNMVSEYKPLEKDSQNVVFEDEDVELTGRKICAFSYRGNRHEVSSWKDMLVQVCKLVQEENPTAVSFLCNKDSYFHINDDVDRTKISEHAYVWTSCSTKSKMSCLSLLFTEAGLNSSLLEFELIPQNDKEVEEDEDN